MKNKALLSIVIVILLFIAGCTLNSQSASSGKEGSNTIEILNVSYDPTREFYEEYNEVFARYWFDKTGQQVKVKQSHGGSGKQARSVMDGLRADVVTLALGYDIDEMTRLSLVPTNWQSQLEYNSAPYTSTIVFLVRSGNPKGIQDWDDLIKPDVSVITPNPKTSGGARWNFLAAWVYAMKSYDNDEMKAVDFVTKLYKNVPVLDSGARGSTTTFVERNIGDVFITWENEAFLAINELGADKFEIVVPSYSILAEPPVAVVDKYVQRRGTQEVAQAYLEYLYSEPGQQIIAQHYFRPRMQSVIEQYESKFPPMNLTTVQEAFGGWKAAQDKFFSDQGIFDRIYLPVR
ncbi:sulfate transporter subunit [Desulfuribacillus stibiiarsenatis]|uniref:Sulfate transporter subunit n=1 Tax=Desulfuribacillus stibiiarsenatis TaxID=1390249 RepID=A0A1E5L4B7_9FIRM|nr:sulfate ABC transporter substrate-binding protein [Desulfuribacillus stibiiarsenatis]OEH84980.1 sulfate transporter subunit [Desulfuribacillus stibiiarsenatis]